MRNLIRSAFNLVGLDVHLQSRLRAAWAEEKRLAQVEPWKQLRRYRPATLLDIGANDGHSVKVFRELMPEVTIYSFEPLADCFAQVSGLLEASPPGKAFHFALGDTDETTVIHRNEHTPSSSLLPTDEMLGQELPYTKVVTEETIEVRRLDAVASQLSIELPLVVKIDVQGFEDRVIRGGRQTIKQAAAIVVELSSYPLYSGQPSFADVHDQLDELGFVFRGTIDQMLSPKDGRILQFDALFENRNAAATPPGEATQAGNHTTPV